MRNGGCNVQSAHMLIFIGIRDLSVVLFIQCLAAYRWFSVVVPQFPFLRPSLTSAPSLHAHKLQNETQRYNINNELKSSKHTQKGQGATTSESPSSIKLMNSVFLMADKNQATCVQCALAFPPTKTMIRRKSSIQITVNYGGLLDFSSDIINFEYFFSHRDRGSVDTENGNTYFIHPASAIKCTRHIYETRGKSWAYV